MDKTQLVVAMVNTSSWSYYKDKMFVVIMAKILKKDYIHLMTG